MTSSSLLKFEYERKSDERNAQKLTNNIQNLDNFINTILPIMNLVGFADVLLLSPKRPKAVQVHRTIQDGKFQGHSSRTVKLLGKLLPAPHMKIKITGKDKNTLIYFTHQAMIDVASIPSNHQHRHWNGYFLLCLEMPDN